MIPEKEHPDNLDIPEEDTNPSELFYLKQIKEFLETDVAQLRKQNASKDETIDRLQSVVYKYEKGFIPLIKEPLIKDLILFKDSFNQFRDRFIEASEIITGDIGFLNDEIEEIFFSHGIDIIQVDGNDYDRTLQIARRKIPTDNPDLDRKVAEVVKDGYRTDDKILRKQEVAVYIFNDQSHDQ